MAGSQTLAFNVLGDASSAARAFKTTADSAALAARGATMASDAMKLQAKSAEVSAGATLALARADKILADAELGLARDTAVANAVLGRQNAALLGSSTAGAIGSMLAAAASGKAPSGGGSGGLAPGIAMAAAAMGIARKQTRLFSDSISQGTPVWNSARKGIFGLNGELQLFGGALTKVGIPAFLSTASTVHLVGEAVIETAGTLAPAAIAFAAFGAAAVPTVQAIYKQMQNLHTIAQATGTQVPGLSGGFSRMAAAVQPQVYQLFGEALILANSGTGQLQVLAHGAGKVLDDLGARFVAATTGGKGFSTFIDGATRDLAGWGNLIGNVGGIFGNLLKVLPGYAEQLLNVLQGVTHGIEAVTGSKLGQWVLGIGLAAHGALFYVGLLGTGLAVLASRTLALVATGALNAATKVAGLGVAGEAAAGGLLAFGGAAEGAAALPWGWIGIAVAGIAVLVYQLSSAKDAAQQFDSAMQNAVQNAPLSQLSAVIATSIAATQARVAASSRDITAALKDQQPAVQGVASRYEQAYNPALDKAATTSLHYSQGLSDLQQQQQLVTGRVASLAKEYGGQASALALLNAAGITSKQVTDKSSSSWAQVLIELQATNAATKEMGISTGALGSSYVNTLLPAVQKVTQAQDTQLNAILGGQQAFVGFQQAMAQAAKDAGVAGSSLSGLNKQSLTLASDFYGTAVPASQKMIAALEAQGLSTKDLTTAVADEVKQLLPFTRNSEAAKSVLVDMVNNALGPGTVSMKNLASWTTTNSGTMQGFKAIVDKATLSAGKLAGVLQDNLNQMLAKAAADALGGQRALSQFALGVEQGDSASKLLAGDGGAKVLRMFEQMYGNNIPRAKAAFVDWAKNGLGLSAGAANGLWDALNRLQGKIASMHGTKLFVDVVASGSGGVKVVAPGQAARTWDLQHLATGGFVSGGQAGKDSVPAMLMPGEVVVPTAMVAGGAVDHLRGKLPGFAGGGLVELPGWVEGQAGGTIGGWAGGDIQRILNAMISQYKAQAAAAARAAGTGGGSVTRWAPDILRVLAMLRQDSSNLGAVEHRINQESGGNPNAINLWDVNAQRGDPSRGLMQVIGATFARYRSFALSSNIYDPMANIFAGINYAIQSYYPRSLASVMLQAGGYDNGGPLMPGYTLAYNGTGKPEMVVPNRGGAGGGEVHVHLHNEGVIGSQQELENWFVTTMNNAARGSRIRWALTQSPSAR